MILDLYIIAWSVGWWSSAAVLLLLALLLILFLYYGGLWFQAYMSGADVSFRSLIAMTFRQVPARMIVTAQIMARQSGLSIERKSGISTNRLESHFLSGGDVRQVMRAIIAAHRAGITLDFDQAAAMDLAGRDILDAVRTSVSPRVIDCPDGRSGSTKLSAVAKNGVELKVRARVTVRTNMLTLIGGATEQTIIARVGQGIVSTIGSAESHMDVMQKPDRISKDLLHRGLDSNTAFEIVSIDILDIDIGQNIGARIQTDQAQADMRVALASAEARRAGAIARQQEMAVLIAENTSQLVLAGATLTRSMAQALGQSSSQFRSRINIPIGSLADGVF
ncbi:MAG: flotillin-like FloA family protein [Planctomycetales bacterium]|nr:flotillin-like FloA family protein [Planctomycetales bacterium]